jgi:hypothetical protein
LETPPILKYSPETYKSNVCPQFEEDEVGQSIWDKVRSNLKHIGEPIVNLMGTTKIHKTLLAPGNLSTTPLLGKNLGLSLIIVAVHVGAMKKCLPTLEALRRKERGVNISVVRLFLFERTTGSVLTF